MMNHVDEQKCNLIIYGTKGDLATKKLLPSLYRLELTNCMHPETTIIGVARISWQYEDYINFIKEVLIHDISIKWDEIIWQRFSRRFRFYQLDITDQPGFAGLKKFIEPHSITIHYLALPPTTFNAICTALAMHELTSSDHRIMMEKPLGIDYITSNQINDLLSTYFTESQIYRIDHYLGKESVLNLFAIRFANSLFASNWDNRSIEQVQITIYEDIGIAGRLNYFDKIGQLRDMVQSHILQIVAIVAMTPPASLSTDRVRDEKVKILRSLRRIERHNWQEKVIRGQYTQNTINDKTVLSYHQEPGANPASNTETFVAIRLDIDNWQWAGVPFYIRTGKRMAKKHAEIVVYFKQPPLNLFSASHQCLAENKLIIRLQPQEGIEIEMLNKVPGLDHKHRLQVVKLDLTTINTAPILDAYERLFLECMRGVQTLFVRRDEIEEAWKWVDTMVTAWESEQNKPYFYPAGSLGPEEANQLLAKDGHYWHKI